MDTQKDTYYPHALAILGAAFGGGLIVFVGLFAASFVPGNISGSRAEVADSPRVYGFQTSQAPQASQTHVVQTDAATTHSLYERLAAYGFGSRVSLADLPQLGSQEDIQQRTSEPAFEPERILINGVEIDLPVLNPNSTDISSLDEALKEGAVRYPLSAKLGEDGNIFIFGHSSGLPIVRNQMYKAFNNLPDLSDGDTITLIGGGQKYVYRVDQVRLTTAQEELVDLSPRGGKRLTLSTCNSFGQKSERWVVEASFVGEFADE